jgi:transcription initiation factor TFIIIB Brf1 subunit/transcription initiation factor TFIIB
MDLEEIWKELDNENLKMKSKIVNTSSEIFVCRNCESDNLNRDGQIICQDCGLVLDDYRIVSNSSYDNYDNTNTQEFKSNKYPNSNKMLKMQEWYMWTNEEKNIYKLKTYIQNLCLQLHIIENIVNCIVETTVLVMNCIKKNDGTKRARVKDGIIIMCIHYVTKDTDTPYSYVDLSKQLNLDMKYVTKAERIILELINSKKLKLDKMMVLKTQNPFNYVTTIINKNNMKISKEILNKVQILISLCEDNDLLLDHTPLSVGVSCFYYILKLENIDIDLKKFSELYNLSVVTVVKTYNKLKIYNDKINKYLASINYSNL